MEQKCEQFLLKGTNYMNVTLRKMNGNEYELFKKYSIEDYAKDLMQESEMSLTEAMTQSEAEFDEMLSNGVDTLDNDLMVIEDTDLEKSVGVIWYLYEITDQVKHTFLSDFIIKKEERRKGYATAALYAMEKIAVNHGCSECRLYVWKHNPKGIALYTKVGYQTFRDEDDGMYMKKTIL